jgi:hypothetical protein
LEALKGECDRLKQGSDRLLEQVALARQQDRAAVLLPDLDELRDRALASLKLGKQATGYKAATKALDRFIQDLRETQTLVSSVKTADDLVTEGLKGKTSDREQYFTALRQLVERLKLGHLYKNLGVDPITYYVELDGERLIEDRELSAIAAWLRSQPLIEELQK